MTTKVKKCVSFDMEPYLWYIEQLDEIDADLFDTLWFNDDDMRAMTAQAARVIDGSNKEDLLRGLEYCSFEGSQSRQHERSRASEAVLGEQLRQQAANACEGTQFDPELIAKEYIKVSSRRQEMACQRAAQDEAEASGSALRSSLVAVKYMFGFSRRNLVQPI